MSERQQFFQSRFLCVFRRNGIAALVHQLHPDPLYVSDVTWKAIARKIKVGTPLDPSAEINNALITRKLLFTNPNSDKTELNLARRKARKMLDRPTILYLMMAQSCNLACTYCPIPELTKKYGKRLLSFEDAVAGIELWKRHIDSLSKDNEPYFIILYGGEPLLNKKVIKLLLPYIAKMRKNGTLPQSLEIMLCTNGSFLDDALAALLARHNVTVALGIDGPAEYNNQTRITADGKSTFGIIKKSIKLLLKHSIRIVASVTITPSNARVLIEHTDFLRKLGVTKFGYNLMKGSLLLGDLSESSIMEYSKVAAECVLSGMPNITTDDSQYEYQLEKKLGILQKGVPFSVDCTCYGNQIVIQPDGQVSNCPFLRHDQGHVSQLPDNFRINSTPIVRKWRKRLPLFNDVFLSASEGGLLDGGGCAWNSFELSKDVLSRDHCNKIFTQNILHELIWKLLPDRQRAELQHGTISYWSDRGFGALRSSGS